MYITELSKIVYINFKYENCYFFQGLQLRTWLNNLVESVTWYMYLNLILNTVNSYGVDSFRLGRQFIGSVLNRGKFIRIGLLALAMRTINPVPVASGVTLNDMSKIDRY